VNETWSAVGHLLSRYRGALLGGIGSAVAVALTLDPRASIAHSSIRFAFWFAMIATLLVPFARLAAAPLALAVNRHQ